MPENSAPGDCVGCSVKTLWERSHKNIIHITAVFVKWFGVGDSPHLTAERTAGGRRNTTLVVFEA